MPPGTDRIQAGGEAGRREPTPGLPVRRPAHPRRTIALDCGHGPVEICAIAKGGACPAEPPPESTSHGTIMLAVHPCAPAEGAWRTFAQVPAEAVSTRCAMAVATPPF